MTWLYCDNCDWSGSYSELVAGSDDMADEVYNHCPECGGTEFDEEDDDCEPGPGDAYDVEAEYGVEP